ncbi:MAG: YaaL family protein [Alicyclobacillus sp.]|nr:YaaL family protein [Alicyclobacillus sp.]
MSLLDEIAAAKRDLAAAEQQYQEATGPWVDVAAYQLQAARARLDLLLREAKERAVSA